MNLPAEVYQGVLARGALVLLRLYLGGVLLVGAIPFVGRDFTPNLLDFLQSVALSKGYPFYQDLVRGVVLPHAGVFAVLVVWGEVFVGAALVLGLATRFAAAASLLMMVNFMLAKGDLPWMVSSYDAAYAMISLALLIGAAGRTLGVDEVLAKRWPRSVLW